MMTLIGVFRKKTEKSSAVHCGRLAAAWISDDRDGRFAQIVTGRTGFAS